MLRRRTLTVVLLTMLCATVAAGLDLWSPAPYVQAEYQIRDVIARHGRTTPANSDLIFLAIDSDSVKLDPNLDLDGLFSSSAEEPRSRRALEIMGQGWPWNREIYALILERLLGAGANVVAFDCLFLTPAPGDSEFGAALDRFRSQVVIASNFVSPAQVDRSHPIPSSYNAPSETLIPSQATPDDRVGFTNFFVGENQVVRGAQFRVAFRGQENSTALHYSLSAQTASKAGRPESIPNDLAEHIIRFTGPPATFRPRPLFEIFVPEYWEHNYDSGKFLRGKTVVVGAEGKWQEDELATPFGAMPGAELHLNALNALWHGEFLKELSPLASASIALAAALLGTALCLLIRSPWLRLLALGAANGLAPVCALVAYNRAGLYLPSLAPLLALNSNVLLGLVSDFTFERIEKARLRSTLKTRDDFTQMIVHDLRSPLTVVSGYIEILKKKAAGRLTPTETGFINRAESGANNMREMITQLLDVSRLEAGAMPLRLEDHDLTEIARAAGDRFSPVLNERTLRFHAPAEPVVLSCDADVIRRVLENLINNAIKFTESKGTITVSVERHADTAALSVSDDGRGIPPDQHKRIFAKFGQVDGGGEHRHSTGLGLAFCGLAVEAHGGKIGVESEPGRGSTFWIKLPIGHSVAKKRPDVSAASGLVGQI
ncbi:MAG: ATP-binding protein [Chthoniobacterales bacterium]